jgi:hypothetical protein
VVNFAVFPVRKSASGLLDGIEANDALHGRIDNLLREVVCADVARDSEEVPSSGFDLVPDRCEALLVDAGRGLPLSVYVGGGGTELLTRL